MGKAEILGSGGSLNGILKKSLIFVDELWHMVQLEDPSEGWLILLVLVMT